MNEMFLNFIPEPLTGDFEAICRVMCQQNVIETELFMLVLKKTANNFFDGVVGYSENLLIGASKYLKSSDWKTSPKQLHFLNEIIYRTPTNTTVFMDALLARIVYFIRIQKYAMARNDIVYYKSLDLKLMTIDGILLVQTLMCSCLYFMRDMKAARCALYQLEEFLDLLSAKVCKNDVLHSFIQHLKNYKKEIEESTNNIQFNIKSHVPINGLKSDIACDFVSEPISNAGVYARISISKGEVVIAEDPHYFKFSAPFMYCEVCAVYQEHLYTCSGCRYKSYCSLTCIQCDWNEHKYECYGFKIGIIQMLEATLLFRCFLQAVQYLLPAIANFTLKNGPIRDATSAWNFIVQHSLSDQSQKTIIREFLSKQPNCKLLTNGKWRQLISTSFRLAVFVNNETNIKDTYFNQLELTKDESIKLIAALLMRLSVHISLNSQKQQLHHRRTVPANSACPKYQSSEVPRMNANAFEYYSINAHSDFVNCYKELQERILLSQYSITHNSNNLQQAKIQHNSPMSEYTSKLFRSSINHVEIQSVADILDIETPTPMDIEQQLAMLSTSKRCQLLSSIANNFHKFIFDYFCYNEPRNQEKIVICAALKKFKYSCLANVVIRSSCGGQYIGKTTMNINAGTELTVCHESLNFLEQSRSERQAILQEIGIICKCYVCTMPASMEPVNTRNGIICAFCDQNMNITQVPGKCSQCHAEYKELLEQYSTFISYMVKEINVKELEPKTTQRELAILYGTYNSYVTMHLSEEHELRFAGVLSFVEFLTSNGFLNHASDVIIAFHCSYYSYYDDNDMIYKNERDATFFNLVQRIMERYMDNLTNSLEMNAEYPKKLLAIIRHILKSQEQYLDPAIDDSERYKAFLENYTLYYKWKKIIISNLLMSKSLQAYLNESK